MSTDMHLDNGLDLFALDAREVAALTAENTGTWDDRLDAIMGRFAAATLAAEDPDRRALYTRRARAVRRVRRLVGLPGLPVRRRYPRQPYAG